MMKKSQIPWCNFTWDPVTGCRRDCAFCIGRKRLTQFKGDSRFYLNDDHIVKNEEKGLFILTKPLSKNGSAIPAPTGFLPTLHPYRLPMVGAKAKTGKYPCLPCGRPVWRMDTYGVDFKGFRCL